MSKSMKLAIPVCVAAVCFVWITGREVLGEKIYLANLSTRCLKSICYAASKCDESLECRGGYCGSFNISRVYWIDSGKIVTQFDDPDRDRAWEDCATRFDCAERIIVGYMSVYGRDCNSDGVIDCTDYLMIHGNGGPNCHLPLARHPTTKQLLDRYEEFFRL